MTVGPVGSVVVPAHQEEAVIDRSLSVLLELAEPGELEVVVACNGCTDRTAERARQHAGVRVLELELASKTAALRAAEEQVTAFPRLYLDADVLLGTQSARALLTALRRPGALAARPTTRYDTTGAQCLVHRYYRTRAQLPSLHRSLWGGGAYGLSAAGRSRFGSWPDVVADDLFVDHLFEHMEVDVVDVASVVVRTPRNWRDLMRVLRRVQRGKKLAGPGATSTTTRVRGDLIAYARRDGLRALPDLAAYVGASAAARLALHLQREVRWERDESSRVP